MPDSPKPSGTTVTHAEAFEGVRGLPTNSDLGSPTQELLFRYIREQEAAEREHVRAAIQTTLEIRRLGEMCEDERQRYLHYEKRAETAEREVTRLRACIADMEEMMTLHPVEVEQARQEGYERGRSERNQ